MTSREHRSRNASPQFRSIKAVFEQSDAPLSRPFSRTSQPRTPTNDPPSPVAPLIARESFRGKQQTIDTLLEASSADIWPTSREPLRPKSSWIGPPPPPSRSTAAMARKVIITYSSPGLQPPVYITTSLSDPQWELLEMGSSESPGGEWEFTKTFTAVAGEYQYKFRLGPGDWWVCDESKPTVDDGFGDRNNVLVVEDEAPHDKAAAKSHDLVDNDGDVFESPTLPHERNSSQADIKRDSLGDDVVHGLSKDAGEHEKHAPLFAHEQNGSPRGRLEVPPEDVPVTFSRQDTLSGDDDEEPPHFLDAPIFDHEKTMMPARTPTPPTPGADEDPDDMAPLMRHETLTSESAWSSNDDHEAEKHSDTVVSPASLPSSAPWMVKDDHAPPEADSSDPSLVRSDVANSTSPIVKATSHSSQSPSLPSVREDEEELAEDLPEDTHTQRPAALMTPPRTPDESKLPETVAEKDTQVQAAPDDEQQPAAQKPAGLDGDAAPTHSAEANSKEKSETKNTDQQVSDKATRSGVWESALGLGLFVAVGVGAAWLAFMMQDPIKDGGAALTGAS